MPVIRAYFYARNPEYAQKIETFKYMNILSYENGFM